MFKDVLKDNDEATRRVGVLKKEEKDKLKAGVLVEVQKPFFWYNDERYEIGQRFVIEAQHIDHNFEEWVKLVAD